MSSSLHHLIQSFRQSKRPCFDLFSMDDEEVFLWIIFDLPQIVDGSLPSTTIVGRLPFLGIHTQKDKIASEKFWFFSLDADYHLHPMSRQVVQAKLLTSFRPWMQLGPRTYPISLRFQNFPTDTHRSSSLFALFALPSVTFHLEEKWVFHFTCVDGFPILSYIGRVDTKEDILESVLEYTWTDDSMLVGLFSSHPLWIMDQGSVSYLDSSSDKILAGVDFDIFYLLHSPRVYARYPTEKSMGFISFVSPISLPLHNLFSYWRQSTFGGKRPLKGIPLTPPVQINPSPVDFIDYFVCGFSRYKRHMYAVMGKHFQKRERFVSYTVPVFFDAVNESESLFQMTPHGFSIYYHSSRLYVREKTIFLLWFDSFLPLVAFAHEEGNRTVTPSLPSTSPSLQKTNRVSVPPPFVLPRIPFPVAYSTRGRR